MNETSAIETHVNHTTQVRDAPTARAADEPLSKTGKPSVLWFKERMPTVVRDGTSLVTMNLAECLAEVFDIDLVTLRLTGREDAAAAAVCPPFRRVEIIQPDNTGSIVKRAIYRAAYELQSAFQGVPRAVLYASGENVRRSLARLFSTNQYDLAIFEYYTTAPLLGIATCPTALILIDATYKSLEYAADDKHGLDRWLGARRVAVMKRFEAAVASRADRCFAISERDIRLLDEAGNRSRIEYLPVLFPPLERRAETDSAAATTSGHRIAFVGNLAYEENRRAFAWFVEHVYPRVRSAVPDAELRVFGGGSEHVPASLRTRDGIEFIGWVENLGAALTECQCGVAPSVSGTGVKIKVLEMMWYGLPVVATTIAAAGTPGSRGAAKVADDAAGFADGVVKVLQDPAARKELRDKSRQAMESDHCGEAIRRTIQETFRGMCAN